jgi:hypothetical protein
MGRRQLKDQIRRFWTVRIVPALASCWRGTVTERQWFFKIVDKTRITSPRTSRFVLIAFNEPGAIFEDIPGG